MPKKKTNDVSIDETTVETPIETETPTVPVELPTTLDELSLLVVSLQNEINALNAEKIASRAEFVKQTDKQLAKVAELNETLAGLQDKVDAANALVAQMPDLQKAYSDARNQTTQIFSDAEKAQKDIEKAQIQIAKDLASIAEQKALNDTTSANLSLLSKTLEDRNTAIQKLAKDYMLIRESLGNL